MQVLETGMHLLILYSEFSSVSAVRTVAYVCKTSLRLLSYTVFVRQHSEANKAVLEHLRQPSFPCFVFKPRDIIYINKYSKVEFFNT